MYNDNGYCKFGQECQKKHFKVICTKPKCDKKCEGRHPRLCRFEENCKFLKKGVCAFKHVTLANDDHEINALKSKMKILETENRNLKEKVKLLEEGIEKAHGINEELKEEIKTKDTTMEESEEKVECLENIRSKNEKDIERLSECNQKERSEIEKLKMDI